MATFGSMEWALDLNGVFQRIRKAMDLRKKYTPCCADNSLVPGSLPDVGKLRLEFRKGLAHVISSDAGESLFSPSVTVDEFYSDMAELFQIRSDGSVGTFCFHRLRLLQTKFELYMMSNFDLEQEEQITNPHRDFYNLRKVDTHIHHSAAMNAKHLLRFIKKKAKIHGSDVVLVRNGVGVTLDKLFLELGLSAHDLSLDKLNVTADQTVFQRFDRFNQKYNPMNQPELRTVFLKTDNDIQGRYLAEITKELLEDLEESKYQHTEWRLSIYGRRYDEWERLATWVLSHQLVSPNNRWMIQVPRLYSVYRASGQLQNFQEMLNNIFIPMFEATFNPEKHPTLTRFLELISGFDSVDDESKSNKPSDRTFSSADRSPAQWNIHENPSYKYYNFYLQTNLKVLNSLRAARGLNQFQYRPHAGEAGELHHLDTAFLLADGIAHGLNLRKSMPLQYLYYLCHIGIAMSPCSNNHLFLSYQKTPFHEFFMRGLNVSLSTDDPLMFHQTKEPLMEEYSLAKQFFRLSSADICELARNSVLQSGFATDIKATWIGSADPSLNDITKTNVPNIRLAYRQQCHSDEMHLILQDVHDAMTAFRAGIPRTRPPTSPFLRPLEVVMSDQEKNGKLNNGSNADKRKRTLVCQRSISVPHTAPESADVDEQMELPPLRLSSPGLSVAESSPKRHCTESEVGDPSVSPVLHCDQYPQTLTTRESPCLEFELDIQ